MDSKRSKIIVLLADGTGNSAAKLFKTNVWRLYRALDVSDPPPDGKVPQIAYYHDGVGTSRFKPLTILGGVFGIGLKRNVIDIYTFLCRNYNPGDRIYVYGFSRGAFTARVLAALILSEGVLRCETEEDLKRYTADAYRRYRRHYKLPLRGHKDKTTSTDPDNTVGLVDLLRNLRDAVLKAWRSQRHQPQYEDVKRTKGLQIDYIDFIGVWDTVAAYGLPIDEMTRGIDEWVWPLSMPNYALDPRVRRARHALSLDDERDTFHPLLWDETVEEPVKEDKPARLQQVWFAGVHSNVGGGYADDSLSYVPLEWMMRESEKPIWHKDDQGNATEQPGLRFLPPDQQELRLPPPDEFGRQHDFGRLYDSRSGVGSYYRVQPRRIAARLATPDPHTLMLQDPNRKRKGFLKTVQVHESVFHRIRAGNDRYAPIVLPQNYEVVKFDGTVTNNSEPAPAPERVEWVWNDIWRRRVNYFVTVGVTAVLALFPVIESIWPPSVCVGPQCLLTPVIEAIGGVTPGFVQPWIEAFALSPGWFLLLALIILLLLVRSSYLRRSVRDGMRELWAQALGLPLGPGRPATAAGLSTGLPNRGWDGWIYRLRTGRSYQRFFQSLKWRGIPDVFGAVVLFGGILLILLLILIGVQRGRLAYAEWTNRFCDIGTATEQASGIVSGVFETKSRCWPTRVRVRKGVRYRITMRVTEDWIDLDIPTSPQGFAANRLSWYMRPSVLLRRSLSGNWFQPMIKIVPAGGRGGHVDLLEMSCACGQANNPAQPGAAVYVGDFEPAINGEVFLYVNDLAARLLTGPSSKYYDNNQGKAEIVIEPYPPNQSRLGSNAATRQ
jgi:uncharacterized protein (DUF2235 family)